MKSLLLLWCILILQSGLFAQWNHNELATVQGVAVDDFLVNDDTTGGEWQGQPSIAMDDRGKFVMVWEDKRNGNSDIYFQRYDASGARQGDNQKANDDTGIVNQRTPTVAMDANGNFVIAWVDYRSGGNIYFQRYDASGIKLGNNRKADDETSKVSSTNGWFVSIAMDSEGHFVIAWVDDRNSVYGDIYFQRFDTSGSKQGSSQKANDDAGNVWHASPVIAMSGNGNCVIAWRENRNGVGRIYFQRYNEFGARLGNNQRTNLVSGEAWGDPPSIAMNGHGGFAIAWINYDFGVFATYFQRYDMSGTMQGDNQKVNNDIESPRLYNPAIAMDDSGGIAVAWQSEKIGQRYRYDLYLQQFDANGERRGSNQHVNVDTGSAWLESQSLAMAANGDFAIVWADNRQGNSDIYFQRYDDSGNRFEKNQKANDDTGSARQRFAKIAMEENGDFILAWLDTRNGNADVYFQRYNSSGDILGNNQQVTDQARDFGQTPSVAVDGAGNFVIAFGQQRSENSWEKDIYFQRYDASGARQGKKQQVNDFSDDGGQSPAIAMDNNGNFVIAWDDLRNESNNIYFQRFDTSGGKQGGNQKVSEHEGSQSRPEIVMHSSGNFIIAWDDGRDGDRDIYFQRYDVSGSRQANNQKANDDTGSEFQNNAGIAIDGNGNFVIAWRDSRNGNPDIYFQRYDAFGIMQGDNQKANDDAGSARQSYPAIAMEPGGNFVIVWQDYRNDARLPDIMGQRYYADGSKRGSNYRIVADGPLKLEERPVVAANAQQIVIAWEDYRRPGKGSDIFAKIASWDWDGVTAVTKQQVIPNGYFLSQNFPNPFNPATVIHFGLPKSENVTLKVYNILGKEIVTLLNNEVKSTGYHTAPWDGRDRHGQRVASGIYVYQLRAADFNSTKKMAVVR